MGESRTRSRRKQEEESSGRNMSRRCIEIGGGSEEGRETREAGRVE